MIATPAWNGRRQELSSHWENNWTKHRQQARLWTWAMKDSESWGGPSFLPAGEVWSVAQRVEGRWVQLSLWVKKMKPGGCHLGLWVLGPGRGKLHTHSSGDYWRSSWVFSCILLGTRKKEAYLNPVNDSTKTNRGNVTGTTAHQGVVLAPQWQGKTSSWREYQMELLINCWFIKEAKSALKQRLLWSYLQTLTMKTQKD